MGIKYVKLNLNALKISDWRPVLDYLNGGSIVTMAAGMSEDKLDPTRALRVPIGFATDGEYLWPLALGHYLEKYSIGFDEGFLKHIRLRGYSLPTFSEIQLQEVRIEFGQHNRQEASDANEDFVNASSFDPFKGEDASEEATYDGPPQATIWDYVQADGQPGIATDHPILPEDIAIKVVDYMENGKVLLSSRGQIRDFFKPGTMVTLPDQIMTDGVWLWDRESIYYIEEYRLSPTKEFLHYLEARDFTPRIPTLDEIEQVLQGFLN